MRRVALLLGTLVLAACGPSVTPPPTPSPVAPSPSATSADSPTPAPSALIPVDSSLLAYLPSDVEGLTLQEASEVEQSVVSDTDLASVANAVAAAVAVDQAAGDFVYAVVVRLRAPIDDNGFRSWRDSYNDGACSQANGVVGTAETQIDGRTVFIGSCSGGLLTYHLYLQSDGVLISASAVGERRLGEHLVENLRP